MVNSKWPLALLLLTPHLFAETNVDSSSINVSSVEIKIATPDIELEEPTFSNLDKQPDNQTELMYGDFSGHYLGKKYQFIFERTSWHQAKEKAETMGGHLACIDTPEKLDYIHSLRTIHGNLNPVWIGLTDQDHEGRWRWLCNKPLNGKMRAWLNRGEGLDSRDYGHLMGRKAFLSRTNSGSKPIFSNGFRGTNFVYGFVVEFNQPNLPPVHDPVEKSYQITSPELFEQVVTIRDRAGKWRGEADVLDTLRLKLEAIIKHNKEFAPAYQTLAKVLIRSAMVNSSFYRRDVLGVAEKHLYQAIQLNPDYGKAFVTMANLLTKARRYDEAKSALLNAATMNVDETTLHLNWGLWRQKQNHKTLAIDHFRVVLDLSSQDSREYQSALGSLAFLYARQENFVKASTHYQALIALRPDDAWTKGNYGFYLFNYEQNIDGAIDFLEQALSIRDYGMARSHLALALYTKWATINELPESSDEAKTYFDQAYSLNPNIKYVISELSRKNHTQQAANALQKWFIQNSHNLPKANVTNTTI